MPKELRDYFKERAANEQRSMNTQIVKTLTEHKNRATATTKKEA
jgi:hypothetical protein